MTDAPKWLKPETCCECGTYGCTIPMPINGRVVYIDYCIADKVAALTAGNIATVASCCGHGKMKAEILLADGTELWFDATPPTPQQKG
jgi:hypothetical protein